MVNRSTLKGYVELLGGSSARLVLQAGYFALLITTLSLAEYGVFASSVAAALIIGCGGGFGFAGPVMRAATTRRRVLPWYIGGLYVSIALAIPLTMSIGTIFHTLFMQSHLGLWAFLAIVLSEAICWRISDAVYMVNVGLGRYSVASAASLVSSGARAAAIVAFALTVDGTLEQWCMFYLIANVIGAVLCLLLMPRVAPRWRLRIFIGRFPQAAAYASSNLVQSLQIEVEKVLVLFLAGQKIAGIFALTIRIIELTSVPIRSFFPLYVRALMKSRAALADRRRNIKIEAAIAVAATALFMSLLGVLWFAPKILGQNVAAAHAWFSALLLLPASKLLIEYHRELFFAANRIFQFTLINALILFIKIPFMTFLASKYTDLDRWILPLNGLYLGLYVMSATLTWMWIFGSREPRAAAPPIEAGVTTLR